MKIVILDGYTVNPGDLSWADMEELAELTVYDRTREDQIISRAEKADILLTNKTVLSKQHLQQLPNLKYIGVLATGVNVVDTDYAKEQGIVVTNVPNYTGLSGAQMVFSLILELTNRVGYHSETVREGKWSESEDFCYWDYPLVELSGKTIGIVGFGGIGKAVASIAQAFGMKVLIHTRSKPADLADNIRHADLEVLFRESDILSLHCPLTPKTEEMINQETLQLMKESAFLINISRGGLINEMDLANALNQGKLAGAAVDVLKTEPADPACPLISAPNCYITPHISWATRASRKRLLDIAVGNLKSFLKGSPINNV